MPQFKSIQTMELNPNEEARTIEGIVSAEVIDKQHEITVQEYLLDGLNAMINRGVAPIAVQHSNHVAGKWTSFEPIEIDYDGKKVAGIKGIGEIFKTPYGDSVWSAIKSGKLKGLSFAGVVRKTPEMLENGERVVMLENKEVWEVSLCEQPAVPIAILTAANTAAKTYGEMALINHQMVNRGGEELVLVACKSNVCEIVENEAKNDQKNVTKMLNINKSNEENKQMKNENEVEKADNAVEKTEQIVDNSELVNKGFEQITTTLETMSKTQEKIVERLNALESQKEDNGDDDEDEKPKDEGEKMEHGDHDDEDEDEDKKKAKKTAKGGNGNGNGDDDEDEETGKGSDILKRLNALEKAIVAENVPAQKMNTIIEEPKNPVNKLEIIMKSAGVMKNPMFEDLRRMRKEDPRNAMANWRANIRAGHYNHLVGKSLAQRFTNGGYE